MNKNSCSTKFYYHFKSGGKTKNEIKETLMVILKPLYCGMIITSHAVGL